MPPKIGGTVSACYAPETVKYSLVAAAKIGLLSEPPLAVVAILISFDGTALDAWFESYYGFYFYVIFVTLLLLVLGSVFYL